MNAPAPSVRSDWEPCNPFPSLRPARTFVNDQRSNDRLRVAYFSRPRDEALYGKAWFGPGAEGPPGMAHGGSVAAVLDEALGAAAWRAGHTVVVARLTVDFRAMVPLGTDATLRAWIERVDGRKVYCRATLTAVLDGPDRDGETLLAEGEALCVMLAGFP